MHRCFWTRTVPRSFCKVGAYGTHRHLRRQTAHAAGDLGAAYPIGGGRRDHRDHTGDNADLHGLSPCGCKGTVCIPRLRRYPPARRWRKRLYGAGCRYILHRSFHTSEIWNDLCHADPDVCKRRAHHPRSQAICPRVGRSPDLLQFTGSACGGAVYLARAGRRAESEADQGL